MSNHDADRANLRLQMNNSHTDYRIDAEAKRAFSIAEVAKRFFRVLGLAPSSDLDPISAHNLSAFPECKLSSRHFCFELGMNDFYITKS
jgi:hypothetical protein